MVVARFLTSVALLILVGCTAPSLQRPEPRDGPPAHTPADLARLPDPHVREEPKSALGNPRSYTVRGKTYRVMDSASGYRASGLASWYGSKFHGRKTSSGESFDMFALTAAHRSLPLPTYLRVTNLQNGRTTVVRVNDRGPFHHNRLIDLSYAGAVKLGFAQDGTARVRLEVIEEVIAEPVEATIEFFLQAGAFRDLATADILKTALSTLTGAPTYVVRVSEDALFRVRLGPVAGRPEALRLQALISASDYGRPLILEH
ncbi:MAG: septal ring lytic transglycosylase RlpA family protein [Gammaproteobacteria bacterium]|nr:septal ring lytic transglycosylase RlpA family protein [Gammaproteobacteria bacterium]